MVWWCLVQDVVRTTGALKAIVAAACDERREYLSAAVAALAFLRQAVATDATRMRVCRNTLLFSSIARRLNTLAGVLLGSGATIEPLDIEAASNGATLVQGCALESKCVHMIATDADVAPLVPALFRVTEGVVARCKKVGNLAVAGVSLADTLASSEMMQSIAGALANLAHYADVRVGFMCATPHLPHVFCACLACCCIHHLRCCPSHVTDSLRFRRQHRTRGPIWRCARPHFPCGPLAAAPSSI